jgi:hypothetical protein
MLQWLGQPSGRGEPRVSIDLFDGMADARIAACISEVSHERARSSNRVRQFGAGTAASVWKTWRSRRRAPRNNLQREKNDRPDHRRRQPAHRRHPPNINDAVEQARPFRCRR